MTGKRILLVEDEALIALFAETALKRGGYQVTGPAPRLKEALHLAATQQLDAAVLDIHLGCETVWPAAAVLYERGIPFLLLSGCGNALTVPEFCESAPRLRKPFSYDAMVDVLDRMLAERML